MKSNKEKWNLFEFGSIEYGKEVDGLLQIAQQRYYAKYCDLRLYCAIIRKAGEDKDEKFFKSKYFKLYCKVLKIEPKDVIKIVKRIWNETNQNT